MGSAELGDRPGPKMDVPFQQGAVSYVTQVQEKADPVPSPQAERSTRRQRERAQHPVRHTVARVIFAVSALTAAAGGVYAEEQTIGACKAIISRLDQENPNNYFPPNQKSSTPAPIPTAAPGETPVPTPYGPAPFNG